MTTSDLFRLETDGAVRPDPGPMLVALDGFIDAGSVGRLLARHLLDTGAPTVVASFNVDQLLDYRGRRPSMVFEANRWVSYDDPALLLHRLVDRDGQTFYILTGPEPDFRWEEAITAVQLLMRHLGITTAVTVHGIPMGVPHTRPVGMSAHATDPTLIGDQSSPFGRVQVPASFAALLELRLGETTDLGGLGFAVHVPHYLATSDFPEGALAALTAITDVTGLNLPNDALVAAATQVRAEIDEAVRGNGEVGEVVTALEQQYDAYTEASTKPSLLATESQHLPSAEELGAEVEDFLRQMGD